MSVLVNNNNKFRLFFMFFLCASLLGSLWAAWSVEKSQKLKNDSVIAQSVSASLEELSNDIHRSLDIYSLNLNTVRAFVYATGLDELTQATFQGYSKDSDFERNYPGARGFGFIRYVEVNDEAEFVERATLDRGDSFRVKALEEQTSSRFVIEYIEPEYKNRQAIGLDIGSETHRRNAALLAAKENTQILTAPITLVQANAKVKHGFLMLLPVFDLKGSLDAKADADLAGWVYAPMLIDEIIASIQESQGNLNLEISDITANEQIEFFKSGLAVSANKHNEQHHETTISLFGRDWLLKASPLESFIESLDLVSPTKRYFQVLGICALVMLFLFNLAYLLRKHYLGLMQKTELAAVVENGIEGTIGLDDQFCLKYWNDAAKQLFAFNDKSSGKPFLDWLIGTYSADYLIDMFKRISKGESVKHVEIKLNSESDDKNSTLNLNFQPIHQEGVFLGANVSMVDVSEVRALHHLLEENNKLLSEKLDIQGTELQHSTSLHEGLLQGADFLIISTDLNGAVTSSNRKLEEVLGYSQDHLVGKSVTNILDAKYLSTLNSNILLRFNYLSQNAFESLVYPLKRQSRVELEAEFTHNNNSRVELHLSVSNITGSDAKPLGYLFLADDVREKKALKFDLELVNSAVHYSEDILLWLDERGKICNSNPFARATLGYSDYELKRLNIVDILPFDINETWQEQFSGLKSAASITTEKSIATFDGKDIPCLITISKLKIEDDNFLFLSAKNISDRLVKEKTLEDALNIAAQANLSKDQFLANMGHELRTPLNEVNGTLQLMKLTDLSSIQSDYLLQAKNSVRALTQSIDDVLDCGEIIRNKLAVHEESFDLYDVITSVGQASSVLAEDKNIEIHFDIANDVPHQIMSDQHRLQQLLMCLMNNAVKFTFDGNILLRCALLKETTKQFELGFEVIDSGLGISEQKQSEIFELFSQAEMGSDRAFGGLGLGLTISKTIVELMSGDISCKSKVGEGSTFSFNIAVNKSEELPSNDDDVPTLVSLKVLIVDDNDISLSVLSKLVDQLGWNATTATGADEAVEKLKQAMAQGEGFDLALIDWNMPKKSGLELVKEIREQFNAADLPILVMVTAHTRKMLSQIDNRDVETMLSAFLTKPVTRTMLVDLVKSVLGPDMPSIGMRGSRQLKLEGYRVLLVEDNETNQFIAKNLLQSQGAIVAIASEGEEAWQILNQQPDRFDIVLMDIQMPGWDGYRATREIRSDARLVDLPILAITANVLASDKRKCFEAGMNGHIGKPFELVELVDEILNLSKKPDLFLAHRIASKKAEKSLPSIGFEEDSLTLKSDILIQLKEKSTVNIGASLKRFGDSEELYVQSLVLFIKDLEKYTDQLINAKDDLTPDSAKAIFHTLKGTSGLLGFKDLANLAMECEQLVSLLIKKGVHAEPFDAFIQCMKQTKHLIQAILEQSNSKAEASAPQAVTIELKKVQLLRDYLKNANMQSVELYAELSEAMAMLSAEINEQLQEAIDQLDFKKALVLLDKFELRYSEFINE